MFDLATWNQGVDDLRGTDAIAVLGNVSNGVLHYEVEVRRWRNDTDQRIARIRGSGSHASFPIAIPISRPYFASTPKAISPKSIQPITSRPTSFFFPQRHRGMANHRPAGGAERIPIEKWRTVRPLKDGMTEHSHRKG